MPQNSKPQNSNNVNPRNARSNNPESGVASSRKAGARNSNSHRVNSHKANSHKANSHNAKEKLASALEDLMEHTSIEKLHVSKIVECAGVSKQAFYYHFSDKYDLMRYAMLGIFDEPLQSLASPKPFQFAYVQFLERCLEKKTFLRNGFSSQDVNSLFRALCYAFSNVFKQRIESQGILIDESIAFYVDFYAKGCAGCTRHWLELGMDLPIKQLSALVTNSVPAVISHYFH